ncbi:MAG: efflux RND transporter periplasmic adaptor subunit [Bryobacter sp.]|nr:efflux RND transporter periplasmic adaptor subunit [Bryobacter sp.]
MKQRLMILGGLMLAGAAVFAVTKKNLDAGTRPAQGAAPVAQRERIAAAGRVEPSSEEIKIGAEMDGKLKAVPVEEGQDVRRGQVLAILENADFAARVELARAELAQREAALERLINGARTEERREAEAVVREAEAHVAVAEREVERRRGLLARGAISKSEYDTAERDLRTMQARVDAARERAAFVKADARADERRRLEAEIAAARARQREVEAMLAKTYIRSPIDGRILRKVLKAGESVTTSGATTSTIVTIGDVARLRVRVEVDETDVARLRLGHPAYVTAAAYGDQKFTGKVVEIGQMLGRKKVRTDEPNERVDTKVLETLVELDPGQRLPVGLRVDAYLAQ